MARRSTILAVSVIAAFAALPSAGALAATAPAAAPVLTSVPYATLVSFQWTPGNGVNLSQSVYRSSGPCATPVNAGQIANNGGPYPGNATGSYIDNVTDGVYCYYIQAADLLATANSPGLTVVVDTHDPAATIAVPNAAAGVVSGTVTLAATAADAASGVATSVLHVGAAGACPSGPVLGSMWNTMTVPNGAYDVCNVVTDNAGHVTIATITVSVANAPPAPPAPPADTIAPDPPTKLKVILPRAKVGATKLRVRLRWVRPTAPDLDRVVVVLNRKRGPKGPADGTVIYRGLGSSVNVSLRAGRAGHVALFAYDKAGNVSKAARRLVSTASLVKLRPLTGSIVDATPHLTWKKKSGSAYYNVQIYRDGERILIAWPSHASYDVPAGKLAPGTYVWFVWPAVKSGGAAPTFDDLIGRATFTVKK